MHPKHGRDLTTGSIPKHLIAFSVPMLMGSFLQTAYSFVNAIWVGQFLGTSALAAVTVSFPVIFVLFAIGMGLTMGAGILTSQSYGAKRFDELRDVVANSMVLVVGVGVVLTIFGELFSSRVLAAMDTPVSIGPMAAQYLRIFLASAPFGFALFAIRSILQGIGDSKTPLYFQFGSVLLTAVLDPLLMFGWLGFPKLGLNGTAWATIIAQVAAVACLVAYLRMHDSIALPHWPHSATIRPMMKKLMVIGLPASVQQSLVSVGMVFVTGIVNGFGEVATAAFGAASRIDQIAFMPAMTLGMAVSTLAGQNIGAGHHHRIKEVFRWGCLFNFTITAAISSVAVAAPEALLRIFVRDLPVIQLGTSYLKIVGGGYVLFALIFVSNGIINGAGHTLTTTLFSLLSLWVVRVPGAYALSHRMGTVVGVWYAILGSFIASLAVSLAYYFSGRWKRPVFSRKTPLPIPTDPGKVFASETGEA